MPSFENPSKSIGYYRDLKKRRDAYRNKLMLKGVLPRSSKMATLMHRKFR